MCWKESQPVSSSYYYWPRRHKQQTLALTYTIGIGSDAMGEPLVEENSREEREAGGELTMRSNVVTLLFKSSVSHAADVLSKI